MSEDNLKDVLAKAIAESAPDPARMANAAAERGRILRRRRAVVQIVASTGLVAVVAGGTVAAALTIGSSGARPSVATSALGGDDATATPAPPIFSVSPPMPSSTGSVSGNNGLWGPPLAPENVATNTPYADLLASLIPEGLTKKTAGLTPKGSADGRVLVDDGKGGALLKVAVAWDSVTSSGRGCNMVVAASECHDFMVGDTRVITDIGDGSQDAQQPGVKYWSAEVVFKDGMYLHLSERNTDRDGNPPTRDVAPLNLDQLAKIAEDPKWDALIQQHPRNS